MALLCAYLACWQATRTKGVEDVLATYSTSSGDFNERLGLLLALDGPSSPMPFVVVSGLGNRNYHFWFFGYVARLS